MLQSTFDDYLYAARSASVVLTNELTDDIQEGSRNPMLNGAKVSFREKTIAAYFLYRYALILKEYTLTDIANNDNDGNQADNRLTRDEMKLVLSGINKFSNLGLNSSEDFILDRQS